MRRLIYIMQRATKQLDFMLKQVPQLEDLIDDKLIYKLRFRDKNYRITVEEICH